MEGFAKGEGVCDVFAGVGPFAVPAGRRRCFVLANDLNPDSYGSMTKNITTNKVLAPCPLHPFLKDADVGGTICEGL